MRKGLLFLIFLAALAACTDSRFKSSKDLSLQHEAFGEFSLKNKRSEGTVSYSEFESGKDKLFVRSEKLEAAAADEMAKKLTAFVESQYVPNTSPYPDMLSKVVKCSEKFLPKRDVFESEELKVDAFDLYSNVRYVYGACLEYQITYRSYYATVTCKKTGDFFEVRYFFDWKKSPATELKDFAGRFKCKG